MGAHSTSELIMDIRGHAALVTGGGSGLGAATARMLAAAGAKVALLDVNTKAAAEVAIDTTLRFLAVTGVLPPADTARMLGRPVSPQRIVTVTDAITIAGDAFEFVEEYRGLEVIARAGTVIARDDGREIATPYDDCVLIMPSRRLLRGQTAVRLGRFTG